MKPYAGYEATKNYGDYFGQLPPGNYEGKIISAKVEQNNWGEQLVVAIDITKGDFAGFYQKQFDGQTENKKWKGTCYLNIPNPSDEKFFVINKTRFENAMFAIEESNKGYHWDWDEKKLKGKAVGLRFRTKEFVNNEGEISSFTQCYDFVAVKDLETAKTLKPYTVKRDDPVVTPPASMVLEADDDDLPF